MEFIAVFVFFFFVGIAIFIALGMISMFLNAASIVAKQREEERRKMGR